MNPNWRAPTVGRLGSPAGMINPSDHGQPKVEELVKTIIQEKIVEKLVDRPVYVVSEEMYKTLNEIAKRIDETERRQFAVEKARVEYQQRLENLLDVQAEKIDELNARLKVELENNQRFHEAQQRLLESHAKHPNTLWGWIRTLWAD